MLLRAPAWSLCCCLVFADGLLGCDTSCDKENVDPVVHDGGTISASCTSYESGGTDEKYLAFPPGRRLRFPHGLGQTPLLVQSYLAFVADPLPQGENGNTAESAGNQVIIEGWNDEFVQVQNDTCEDFYLRLVLLVDSPAPDCLSAGPGSSTGGAAGAGG